MFTIKAKFTVRQLYNVWCEEMKGPENMEWSGIDTAFNLMLCIFFSLKHFWILIFGPPLIVLPRSAFYLQKSKDIFSKHALCGYFIGFCSSKSYPCQISENVFD